MGGATISTCGKYRYTLWRDSGLPLFGDVHSACFLMLNPSTADAEVNDPTIVRCMGYARDWGYNRLLVVNLYAWRATEPADLWRVDDPVGPNNDGAIRNAVAMSDLTVCAWGANARADRVAAVLGLLAQVGVKPHYLKLTGGGQPSHPLYLKKNLKPLEWTWSGN